MSNAWSLVASLLAALSIPEVDMGGQRAMYAAI